MQKVAKHKPWQKIKGYNWLHKWIGLNKPKPESCEEGHKKPPYDAANISGQYKRDIEDFRWLCRGCHVRSDGRLDRLLSKEYTLEIRAKISEANKLRKQ